jgi:hypothetical protein
VKKASTAFALDSIPETGFAEDLNSGSSFDDDEDSDELSIYNF